jgi:mRNA-degrading endonuclease RelE of RelBE toxin-antitoxin system
VQYEIVYTYDAIEELECLTKRQQQIVLDAVEGQLTHEPTQETRNRKHLRDNPLATWELRVERMRVFYNVEESRPVVTIVAVGIKRDSRLFLGRNEYKL